MEPEVAWTGGRSILAWLFCIVTGVVILAPGLLRIEPDRRGNSFEPPRWRRASSTDAWNVLGTDYLGRPFLSAICSATSATARVALSGTIAVMFGVLIVGIVHGSARSPKVESLLSAGNLGVMAVPEAAVLITIATVWPRTAPAWQVNASMLAVLVLFAIPTGARLIAERVRAVNRTGFVSASRACGASHAHIFWHDVRPHLVEDIAWITASVLPRFVAIEVGLAYLGVEYREFEGLGRVLSKSFANMLDGVAFYQMLLTIAAILWIALIPQVVARWLGTQAVRGELS